ncbi:LAMI_0B02366g1_1 [Lachancea mirantina]|uniref:LAMI_0B02366g1_1 n=1 Tax=Lachancea mirantina TaxID=1230905 RepID=A0A1G4IUJ7_9SACH|nr:LAMI_0B02366g1_1 [Lachancea mirantina]
MSEIVRKVSDKFEVVLASSSARRYEILHEVMGFNDITLMKPSFEENLDKRKYVNNPKGYVRDTSAEKARGIRADLAESFNKSNGKQIKPKLVICADTVVIDPENNIHEKPKKWELQLENLLKFRNAREPLRVVTAVNLIKWISPQDFTTTSYDDETEIYFDNELPVDIVHDYVQSGDALEVAGGLKVQTFGGSMIQRINGDFFNVVGLPLNRTFKAIYRAAFEA